MTEEQREAAFQRHLDLTVHYFRAIHEAGDVAWFEVGHERRSEAIALLGLPEDIAELALRRAFIMRRFGTQATQRGDAT